MKTFVSLSQTHTFLLHIYLSLYFIPSPHLSPSPSLFSLYPLLFLHFRLSLHLYPLTSSISLSQSLLLLIFVLRVWCMCWIAESILLKETNLHHRTAIETEIELPLCLWTKLSVFMFCVAVLGMEWKYGFMFYAIRKIEGGIWVRGRIDGGKYKLKEKFI